MPLSTSLLSVLLLTTCSCGSIESAGSSASFNVASGFVDRGVTQYDKPALQTAVGGHVHDEWGNLWAATAWAHVDGSEHVGDGVFASGNAGEASQIDLIGGVSRRLGVGAVEFLVTQTYQPGSPRPTDTSTEIGAFYTFDTWTLQPRFELSLDVNDVNDVYLSFELRHPVAVEETWQIDLVGHVGWFGDDMALSVVGERASGFGDLFFGPQFERRLSERSALVVELLYHRSVEEAYRKFLRDSGVSPDNIIAVLGIVWSF